MPRPSEINTPPIFIDASGGNVYFDQPPGLNTIQISNPVTFFYGQEGIGEADQSSYNSTRWIIEGLTTPAAGMVIYDSGERPGVAGSLSSKLILNAGFQGLNLSVINTHVEANPLGGIFQVKITCTASVIDDAGNTVSSNEAYFLLDVQFDVASNKTNADINEDGTFDDPDDSDAQSEFPDSLIPLPPGTPNYAPFKATITGYGEDGGIQYLDIDESWNEYKSQLPPTTRENFGFSPELNFLNYNFTYKSNDREDLNTYLHFGDDKIYLTTNIATDAFKYPRPPHSAVFKMYEPLPAEINEKDKVYIVREILPVLTETVELVSYDPEDDVNDVVDIVVLRTADNLP